MISLITGGSCGFMWCPSTPHRTTDAEEPRLPAKITTIFQARESRSTPLFATVNLVGEKDQNYSFVEFIELTGLVGLVQLAELEWLHHI